MFYLLLGGDVLDIDVNDIKKNIEKLKSSIVYDKAILDKAMESNEKKKNTYDRYQEYNQLGGEIREYKNKMVNLLALCNERASKYRDERKELVERVVEDNLGYIYPEEDFKVKLELDITKKGRESCQLLLGSKVGNSNVIKYSVTTAKNGRFVRQLVAVVVVYTLNYLRGSEDFFMDEAFSSSDSINLIKLKPLMNMIVKDGMQVLLVEHKHEMYTDLNRRQINLIKNRNIGESKILSVKDLEGVENDVSGDA